jgi:STE24 endopeptidase
MPAFDPVAATEALLASVPREAAARSDAYFEGGYWLQLWGALVSIGAAWLLLHFGIAARMRDLAERVSRRPWLAALAFAPLLVVALWLLQLPWSIYADFWREHRYGLSTQSFGPWLREAAIALGVSILLGTPALAVANALLRRAGRAWWPRAGVLAAAFASFSMLIGPVYIEPLFNTYTPLAAGPLRDEILSLARANGVPSDDVLVVDASRQTTRISANVAGLLGTTRIALNDNLLKRCSREEILAVLGHEMGHYAMGHPFSLILELSLLATLGFWTVNRAFAWLQRRYGARWRVRGLGDLAALPVLYAGLTLFLLLTTPVQNAIVRTHEAEADLFGLDAARQPDGFASVALKLGQYRKLSPGPVEEWLMFDHPSGRSRILMAMRWKAEQPARESAGQP